MFTLRNGFILLVLALEERSERDGEEGGGTDESAEGEAGELSGPFSSSGQNHFHFKFPSQQEEIKSVVQVTKSADAAQAHLQAQLRSKEAENRRLTSQLQVQISTSVNVWLYLCPIIVGF